MTMSNASTAVGTSVAAGRISFLSFAKRRYTHIVAAASTTKSMLRHESDTNSALRS